MSDDTPPITDEHDGALTPEDWQRVHGVPPIAEEDWPPDYGPASCRTPVGRDLSDIYIEEGGAAVRAALGAADYLRPATAFFPAHRWDDKEPPPVEYLMEPWLAAGSAALLAGEGGTGKSLLGQLLCSCAALGVPFLGYPINKCSAAYITCEDGYEILRIRQHAINKQLGVCMADYGQNLQLCSWKGEIGVELGLVDAEGHLAPTNRYEELRALRSRLTVLDNAAHFFAGNEIIRHDVAAFCGLLERLSLQTNGTVVLLAHTPKNGAEYSGSTGWDAHVRQRMFLSFDSNGVDADVRVLKRSKANYARRGETVQFRWWHGTFVREDDIPGDKREEMAANAAANHDNDIFLHCLALRNEQQRRVSEASGKAYAPAVFAAMVESKGIGKQRLEQAMDRLFRNGKIEIGYLWRLEGRDRAGLRFVVANASPTDFANAAPNSANGRQRDANATSTPANTHEAENVANGRQQFTSTVANTPLSKDNGAATEAAAPKNGGEECHAPDDPKELARRDAERWNEAIEAMARGARP